MYKQGRPYPTPPGLQDGVELYEVQYTKTLEIGDPTQQDNLQELINHIWSSGVTNGCEITDNLDGTISLAAGYAMLRDVDSSHADLHSIEVAAQLNLPLTDNSINWVYLDYNAGAPVWKASTSISSFNCTDKCVGYTIYRYGTKLNIINATEQSVNSNTKMRRLFLHFARFIHAEGGTELGSNGLALTVSVGSFYFMLEQLPHAAFDTSIAGTANANVFTLWYRDGVGGWTETVGQKTIDSTTYDNDTGAPVALQNNWHGVSWVYIVHDEPSSLHVIMGQAEYNKEADALIAQPPSSTPGLIAEHGTLIGYVIYFKGDSAFLDVLSAFTTVFTSTAATTHNGLAGIQGGTLNEYYHLTAEEFNIYNLPVYLSGSILGSLRVVYIDNGIVNYATTAAVATTNHTLALTLNSAGAAGVDTRVLLHGRYSDPSWSWSSGPIYLGVDGLITQVMPTALHVELGYAIDATTIYFNPEPPIVLI